mmetsp:Transcript_42617/g.103076  ORF Transcript_42617/g.103076 Transcript_42617/m.103076 type:complete len:388 (-) Transcript_42617:94-1257(-)|eukprot:CAMPEP_0113628386 /NCGR_PEP_ID=MMETSP0017_2-20120614/14707_1 /TAXON_ID=2856 /ORGANISM="Cylindrotheca closterium" /LENGTH=387 /DNA_ID=CAMNT_0000538687 /DNA_START=30 /DNA_END=1193 /DNA_ORIENTATION=- /assembly_acc=CAM_ASM_000147
MKLDSEEPRDGERALSSKKCAPKTVCGISMCCCLLGCLLPGIALLIFTFLTYGNYESVQARVVGQTFCGYYRRNLMKGFGSKRFAVLEDDNGEMEPRTRRMKRSGSGSSSSSSTNKKQNHYKMTYEFLTLEGENITTTTDYCVKARRPINSTEYLLYDPDDPYTVVHETRPSGYLVAGVSLAAIGGVFMCAACVIYKFYMSIFGDLLASSNNNSNTGMPPEPTTEHSESNHGGGIPATTGLASVFSQFANPNVNTNSAPNSSSNGSGNPASTGLASVFSQFTNPNHANTPISSAAPTQTPPPTSYDNSTYGNSGSTYGNTADYDNNHNSNTYSNSHTTTYGDNNTGYNPSGTLMEGHHSTAAPPPAPASSASPAPPASVNMTGYQPP